MKKAILTLFILCSLPGMAQLGIGVKAGLNFANVTNTAGFNNSSRTGYLIGGYIAPKAKKLFGFRSELILSRQGYDYKTNTNTGNVNLDYLLLPQLITLNFTKRFQLHIGGQVAFLLNAKVDSTNGNNSGSLFNYFNRFDYGLAAGAEVSPISGLFMGARINVSFNNANKEAPSGGNWPGFIPRLSAKNNVVQLYAGWRF
ncbi:MAG TPA: porin family protein [Chitinophagaceae bacterium]